MSLLLVRAFFRFERNVKKIFIGRRPEQTIFSHHQTSDRFIWVEVQVSQLGDYLARVKVAGASRTIKTTLKRFCAL